MSCNDLLSDSLSLILMLTSTEVNREGDSLKLGNCERRH